VSTVKCLVLSCPRNFESASHSDGGTPFHKKLCKKHAACLSLVRASVVGVASSAALARHLIVSSNSDLFT